LQARTSIDKERLSLPKPFVAGEVLLAGRQGECAYGVKVTLTSKAEQKTFTTKTDFLGDFEFKGLVVGGEYTLRAKYQAISQRKLS
jgi:hypothetical protein